MFIIYKQTPVKSILFSKLLQSNKIYLCFQTQNSNIHSSTNTVLQICKVPKPRLFIINDNISNGSAFFFFIVIFCTPISILTIATLSSAIIFIYFVYILCLIHNEKKLCYLFTYLSFDRRDFVCRHLFYCTCKLIEF